jgi:hypothetical protein
MDLPHSTNCVGFSDICGCCIAHAIFRLTEYRYWIDYGFTKMDNQSKDPP